MNDSELKLSDVIATELSFFWAVGEAPSRKILLERIKDRHPLLKRESRLDVSIAQILNRLADTKVLRRVDGKFYHPGARMEKHFHVKRKPISSTKEEVQ